MPTKISCDDLQYTKVICNDCNAVISEVTVEPTGQHVFATDEVDNVIDMCIARYGEIAGVSFRKYYTFTENEWVVDYCVNCFYADYDAMYLPYTDYEIAEIMLLIMRVLAIRGLQLKILPVEEEFAITLRAGMNRRGII